MSRRENLSIGVITNTGESLTGITVLRRDATGMVTESTGTSLPTGAGYAVSGDFRNTTTGVVYRNEGSITSASFVSPGVAASAIAPVKMATRTLVALTDGAATPTIAQLMASSQFTITPTTARTFTLPTAALTVAGLTGSVVGTWFDFDIVNTAAFAVTVTINTGWTLTGNMVVNKGAASFRAIMTNVTGAAEAVTLYRMNSGATIADMALASGKIYVGQSTGLAAEVTPSSDITIDTAGAVTIASAVVTRAKMSVPAGSVTANLITATIATTGTTSGYTIVAEAGSLASVDFSGVDVLAAHDSNYITFSITNLGQTGVGSTAMLAATDANTTKATGGTALAANSKRSLAVHGTGGNLVVDKGDRLIVSAAATGTLANTVTFPAYALRFSGTT